MQLRDIKGIGEKTEKLFNKTGVYTAEDLICNYPANYDEYRPPVEIKECEPGQKWAVFGAIQKNPDVKKVKNLSVTATYIRDNTGILNLTWFNMPYLRTTLKRGHQYVFRGKVLEKHGKYVMEQPEIFTPAAYEGKLHFLQPVYHLTKGLSNNAVQKAVREAFVRLESGLSETLPEEIRQRYRLMERKEALRLIHFPTGMEALIQARRRLVFDEFVHFILGIRKLKETQAMTENHFPIKEVWDTEEIMENLPYRLTNAQMRVWQEIERDLSRNRLMSRLIQGDVGSGKTILAFLAMIMSAKNGYQSAMMVPTEVLAKQHYDGFMRLMSGQKIEGLRAVLLTGSQTAAQKRSIYADIENGQVQIIIGTHALIQEKVVYKNLALVITDEQHRFGVRQREKLATRGYPPNILVMSATPIPRTLAIILYGDLDISILDELPAARLPIKNCVVPTSYRETAYRFMERQIAEGRQVYVICPMVEPSEEAEGENVTEYGEKLRGIFPPDIQIGILHGQMRPAEKNAVMESFQKNEIQVLVSTTVVEVGVDVPNATVMMIENAERFGLAQLHQLRGRVGRGRWQSYCIFIQGSKGEEKSKRLDILNRSNDGFQIAAEDLKLRGPGDFFGIRQSGEMEFLLADVIQDADLLQQAAEAAPLLEEKIECHREINL